ncbi:hypothetical protein Celgi_1059 [Cellulomonas gilvus ATCC 13127]|uniref:Uncharacterized protein n=1 Tax=Cellulomonas gilvus (strain ATCC 13127 / NRRL B-14078) TaxID=593907 RepID=F8A0V6_CELGA|nr:hypothetical protein Celgi_1059 [Cellulomonas gilvus ATCC 13127]
MVVCVLTFLEAAVAAGFGVAWAVDLVAGEAVLAAASVFLVLVALGVALLLTAAGRGLWRGRRWARSPVMMWQVLLVVLAVGWLGAEVSPGAVAALVVALVVGVGLLLPPVVAATTGADEAAPTRT